MANPQHAKVDVGQPELFALAEVQFVPTGDGNWRTVKMKPVVWASVRDASRLACVDRQTIYKLYHAGEVVGRRPTPRKIEIDMASLRAKLKATEDAEHWNAERRKAYRSTRKAPKPQK